MRTLVAKCTVEYTGRLTTNLSLGTRLILIKNDGSVAVHCDEGAYKPMNWMSTTNDLTVTPEKIIAINNKEKLEIIIHEILDEYYYDLGEEPGLVKDGMESQIQTLLFDNPEYLEEGLSALDKEHPTDVGLIDLLCVDKDNVTVVVEIKRKASIHGVDQLSRYLECLNETGDYTNLRGILVASSFTRNCKAFATKRGVECIRINYEDLKGYQVDKMTSLN